MTYRVRVLRHAEIDLLEIQRYVARDAPAAAVRLVERLLDAIDALGESPVRSIVPRDDRLQRMGFRFLTIDPFLIFYKVVGREVRVYRVLHAKRAYGEIL